MTNYRTITSLALLKVNLDTRRADYVDYLVPFVARVLSDISDRFIVTEAVSPLIASSFGLQLPHHTLELVIRRLAKRGYLDADSGVYVVKPRISELLIPDSVVERSGRAKSDSRLVMLR